MLEKIKSLNLYLFRPELDVRDRLINALIVIVLLSQFPDLVVTIMLRKNWVTVITQIIFMIVCYAVLIGINRTKEFRKYIIVLICVTDYILLPIMYFTSGGYNSGMLIWMILGAVSICIMLEGLMKYFLLGIDFAIIIECMIVQINRPEYVQHYRTDLQQKLDMMTVAILVSVILGMVITYAIKIYESQTKALLEREKELEKLNEDLTEVNENLEKASNAKSSFLANMSHEIRTPINAVLGMNEMILRECNDENVLDYANDIDSAGHQLLSLINDILDFSKIESKGMELHPVEYDLFSIMNDCYNMIIMRAKRKNLRVELENNPKMPAFLYGDEVRIRQVIMNLLTNSVKYTMDGYVRLMLDYEDIDDETINMIIEVKDTGIGIAKEDMASLFTAFKRFDEMNNRTIEGIGLGLAITKKFVDMMGGSIEVSSAKGEGSVFTVVIPQKKITSAGEVGEFFKKYRHKEYLTGEYIVSTAEIHTAPKEEPKVGEQEISGLSRLKAPKEKKAASFTAPDARVLIVDDVKMNLNVVRLLLKNTEIQVDLASSGEECLKYTLMKHYDLILMDHMMPDMDGIVTFHNIQKQEMGLNNNTPVIVLTANAIQGVEEMYQTEGFVSYVSKPVKGDALESELIKHLPSEKVTLAKKEDE